MSAAAAPTDVLTLQWTENVTSRPPRTEHYRGQYEPGVVGLLFLLSVLGTVGNTLIIGAVCTHKRLRTRGNVFVVNLAVADLIITAYILPLALMTSLQPRRPYGDALCSFNALLMMTSLGVSTQSLMMISLERYLHVCHAGLYHRAVTPRSVTSLVCVCWLYTLLWTVQGYTGWTSYVYSNRLFICMFSVQQSHAYATCLALFGMLLPIVTSCLCYRAIFVEVRRRREAVTSHREKQPVTSLGDKVKRVNTREYRLICTLLTIVIVFIICWTPCLVTLATASVLKLPRLLYIMATYLAFLNSCFNSVIYGVMNRNFRSGYLLLLHRLCCCARTCCKRVTSPRDVSNSTGESKIPTADVIDNRVSVSRDRAVRPTRETLITGAGQVIPGARTTPTPGTRDSDMTAVTLQKVNETTRITTLVPENYRVIETEL